MQRFLDGLQRGIERLSCLGEVLAEIGACVLAVVVIWGVIITYFFKSSDTFSVEMSEYLLVFICFASIAFVLQEGRHVKVEAFVEHLSPMARARTEIVALILALAFCALVFWKAAGVTLMNYQRGFRSASLVSLPLWIPYLLITVGFLLISLQYVVQIRKLASRSKSLSKSSGGEEGEKGRVHRE